MQKLLAQLPVPAEKDDQYFVTWVSGDVRTSMSSLGSPSRAKRHHLASPGNIAAKRTLLSGTSPNTEPSSNAGAFSKNTFFSKPSKSVSVARSRQTSRTLCILEEARSVRVSERSAWKVESGAAANREGIPPCVKTCCRVSDVGGNRVDTKLWEIVGIKSFHSIQWHALYSSFFSFECDFILDASPNIADKAVKFDRRQFRLQ